MTDTAPTLHEFNAADPSVAGEILRGCLDIDSWVAEMAAGRPYPDLAALQMAGSEASVNINWDQVSTALARHPRIGAEPTGAALSEADAARSATEQSGVISTDRDDLATGNATYEERFGHIFLICAAGLTGAQMLAALRQRLTNDDATEHAVVISELRKIAQLRLAGAVVAG